jgi:hypothetical protein
MIGNPIHVKASEFNLVALHSKSLDAIHLDDKKTSGLAMRGHFAQRAVQWFHKDRVKLENADVTRRFLHAISNSLQEGNDFAVDSSTLSDEQRSLVLQKVRDRLARQYEGQAGLTAADVPTTLLFVTQLLNPQVQLTVEHHPHSAAASSTDSFVSFSTQPPPPNTPPPESTLTREPLLEGASGEELIYEEVVDSDEPEASPDAASNKGFEEIYDLGDGTLKANSAPMYDEIPATPSEPLDIDLDAIDNEEAGSANTYSQLDELDLGDQFVDVQENLYETIPDQEVEAVTEQLMRTASQVTRRDSNASFVSTVETQPPGESSGSSSAGANADPIYDEVPHEPDDEAGDAASAADYERPVLAGNVEPKSDPRNRGAEWFNLLSSDNDASPIWQTLENYPGVPRYTKAADVVAGSYDERLNHMLTAMGNSKFGRPDPTDPDNQKAMVKQCLAISRDVLLSHWMRLLGPESDDSPVHAALKKKRIKPESERAQLVSSNYAARLTSIIIAELQRIARDDERNHETEARIVTTRLLKLSSMVAEQAVAMSSGKK